MRSHLEFHSHRPTSETRPLKVPFQLVGNVRQHLENLGLIALVSKRPFAPNALAFFSFARLNDIAS